MPDKPPIWTSKDLELAEEIAQYYADPLGGILFMFPWGEPGPLENFKGPRPRQERFLIDLGDEIKARKFDGVNPVTPIRMSVSSGHGEGKSALIGMLSSLLMATRDGLKGTVTANTGLQLSTKTWASIRTWAKYSICAHWFDTTSERFFRLGRKDDWFMSPQSCAEENSEAFAGQHNVGSTSLYIFDEDSNVSEKIHEVAEGGLTDGEAMFLLWGNPTRRNGSFFDINFGQKRDFWNRSTLGPTRGTENCAGTRVWDAHDSPYANRELLKEWEDLYGYDSDFYRVRVRGLPPNAGDAQFIAADLIHQAQRRNAITLDDDPLVAGCDLAWGGKDQNTIRFRRGTDARSIPPIHIPGELTRDPAVMVMKLSEVLSKDYNGHKVAMLFLDSAGIAGPVARRLRELGFMNVIEVNFGAHSPDVKYENMRAYMWGMTKDWLPVGAIDRSQDLEADLQAPGYKLVSRKNDSTVKILLEKKEDVIKRLGHSTDDADSLALTFSMPVKSKQYHDRTAARRRRNEYVGPLA